MADATAVFGDDVAISAELVLVGGESFDAHRTPRVQLAVTDPHLGTQAVAITIRKTCGCIVEHASGIDFLQKALSGFLVLRNNAFGMPGTVPVNVFQPLFQ